MGRRYKVIPLKLTIKNFLSYGDDTQVIDLSGHGLICLSGKNGHGKSALLDAMTWSLWGQARKTTGTSKADEGLIRLGQTRMLVDLEFLFNRRHYRVHRECAKTYGKPYNVLDFEVLDEEAGRFISLTDKTIKATQTKIEQLIGLDYETFINASFLRQGQSNEFSKKSPRERKQILTTILGLSEYEQLQHAAQAKSKALNDERSILLTKNDELATEIAKEAELDEVLDALEKSAQAITLIFADEQKKFLDLTERKNDLEGKEKQRAELFLDRGKITTQYHQQLQRIRDLAGEWRSIHRQAKQSYDIAGMMRQRDEMHKQETVYREAQQKLLQIQEHSLAVKEKIHTRQTVLKNEADLVLRNEWQELERTKFTLREKEQALIALQKNTDSERKKLAVAVVQKQELEFKRVEFDLFSGSYSEVKKQFEKRRTYYQLFVSRGNSLKRELAVLVERREQLRAQESACCPLCEQVLTQKRCQFLLGAVDKQVAFCEHQIGRLSAVLKSLKALLLEQHDHVQKLEVQYKALMQAVTQNDQLVIAIAALESQIAFNMTQEQLFVSERESLLGAVVDLQKRYEQAQAVSLSLLEKDDQLVSLMQSLKEYEEQRAVCAASYDKQKHDDIVRCLRAIIDELSHLERFKEEIARQQSRRQEIVFLVAQAKKEKMRLADLDQKITSFDAFLAQKDVLAVSLQEQEAKLLRLTAEQQHHDVTRGGLLNQKALIAQYKETQAKNSKTVAELEYHQEQYGQLIEAFGKNGIQALLIEEAIPEIEQEANALLSRLTDNQAQIFIESLKDLKKGGVKETLDIHISDAAGVRPYEMFSGGEAFRIDFALRIAISKLLARRAGTALQTLIIDEGFGSQDDEGLSRIMDVLYAIRSDFSKIIVVSHLESMKDGFPVHFIVEKTSSGSSVSVYERG